MTDSRHDKYLILLNQIADFQKKKLTHEEEQKKIFKRTRVIHAQHELEIGTAKNSNDKILYSNEQLRRAALTLKLDGDAEFCNLREKLENIDHEISTIVIEINKLIDCKYLLMLELGIPLNSENEKYPDLMSTIQ